MTIEQYNAYCEGHSMMLKDQLAIQVQAAYYNAYWSSFSKHKKSLQFVLDNIYKKKGKPNYKPIDVKQMERQFKQLEELRLYGYTKE